MGWMVRRRTVRRSPAELLLAAEALLLLAFFRVCLALVPVRRIVQTIARGPASDATRGDAKSDGCEAEATVGGAGRGESAAACPDVAVARRVRWAVEAVARHSPVRFVCFPQTLAGYAMLRRRGVRGTMVYGVARSPAGKLTAHTWLLVGDRVVLGAEGADEFTPVERWG